MIGVHLIGKRVLKGCARSNHSRLIEQGGVFFPTVNCPHSLAKCTHRPTLKTGRRRQRVGRLAQLAKAERIGSPVIRSVQCSSKGQVEAPSLPSLPVAAPSFFSTVYAGIAGGHRKSAARRTLRPEAFGTSAVLAIGDKAERVPLGQVDKRTFTCLI